VFARRPDETDHIGIFLDLNPIGGAGLSEAGANTVELGTDG
jgi:hypothetical protein